jgi:hypothetical protein
MMVERDEYASISGALDDDDTLLVARGRCQARCRGDAKKPISISLSISLQTK